jgi:uncharacterized protein YbaP (TraB family)
VIVYKLLLRRCAIILFISFNAFNGFSQQNTGYTLLWKISGNGLSKPSYLFGTMHVKDKRVFNFSDSVMISIQNCSRFALEVHPDTIMNTMFEMLQSTDSLRRLDKLLSKEEYEKLAKKFEEKNGYPMGKIDPMIVESLMEPNEDKADDKITFVDAYLYGIARTLNKNIFGLEDASSQFDQYYGSKDIIKNRLLDLLDEDGEANADESKEEMVKIYSTGNLDAIYKYAAESGTLDSVITERNKVMANSMIKYMKGETLFAAVGAAHLPGPDGVIALLRKAGYEVMPVQASFTGVAGKYHIDYMKMDWPVYRNEELGYSLEFPGTPIKTKIVGLKTIIYPDMANNVYYGLNVIPEGTSARPANRLEVINKAISNFTKDKSNQVISKKESIFNKLPCTEVIMKVKSQHMRMRLIFANNLLYCIYAGSKLNHLYQPYIDRYFNSFTNFSIPGKPSRPWITYTDSVGAFTVKLPEQPRVIAKEVPGKMKDKPITFLLNLYMSDDTPNFKSYVIRYNNYPEGTFIKDKKLMLDALVNDFKARGKLVGEPVKILKDGIEGYEIKVILTGGYYSVTRMFVKGNRVYMLLKEVIQADLTDDTQDPFFDSFNFTSYIEPVYYTYQQDNPGFKIEMASKPKILIDSSKDHSNFLNNTITCYSTNPASGGLYGFEYSKISPYYRTENVDSLYANMVKRLTGYQDSLLKVDTILLNGIKAREILTIKTETGEKTRTRMLINDEYIFFLISHLDNSELYDRASNVFYNSLTFTRPLRQTIDLSSSKAEKISRDLGSTDTATYKNALGALSYYKFTPAELPHVYSALQRNYTDDTSKSGARYLLIEELKKVNNDSTSMVLLNLYHNLKGKDMVKGVVLSALPAVDKKSGYDNYIKLLTSDAPLKTTELFEVFRPLTDSVEFAAENFEKLLPFVKYDGYRSHVLRLARNMADKKNSAYDKILRTNYVALTAYGMADLDNYLSLKDSAKNDWYGSMYNYIQLMNKITSEDFNEKFTKRYLEKDPKGSYVSGAVVARINNGLNNVQLLVNKLLDSIDTRYDIMEAYNNHKQLNRVPLKYRKQDAYASLCLYQYISADDYGSPQKITFLGSIIKNGAIYYVFKYLLPDREEKASLIGITGPYKPGSAKLNFEKYYAYTDYDVVKTNWRLQAAKMITPLKDAYK